MATLSGFWEQSTTSCTSPMLKAQKSKLSCTIVQLVALSYTSNQVSCMFIFQLATQLFWDATLKNCISSSTSCNLQRCTWAFSASQGASQDATLNIRIMHLANLLRCNSSCNFWEKLHFLRCNSSCNFWEQLQLLRCNSSWNFWEKLQLLNVP